MTKDLTQNQPEPSPKARRSNLDLMALNTAEFKADLATLAADYPNVVARRRAMMRGEMPPNDSKKTDLQ